MVGSYYYFALEGIITRRFISFSILASLLLLFSCSHTDIEESHKNAIEKNGWEIKKVETEEKELNMALIESDELYTNLAIDTNDIGNHKLLTISYELTAKCSEENIGAGVFYTDENIIETYLQLPTATPGTVQMTDKESFLNEYCQ
ncbi:hypothetical protein [Salimicrobium flavidum]|uniref:DUF4830 domain-containing protein n=1 Tax=Salimicrobium flavidum TaxID=570947 RepID=A0A1N7KPN9_9BACI|nr:hypothetical protein [Salimicrobium flavidum]SIS63524.1 hypothetical protein SAMN05421687_11526 [Salimicrobium flavidum]